MFKFYLQLDNEYTYENCYEVHRKNCPLIQGESGDLKSTVVELGHFNSSQEALKAAEAILTEKGLNPMKLNGCLACSKESHKR